MTNNDQMREALEAFVKAGGASPRMGITRFSFWRLDQLAKAFDLAVAALSPSPSKQEG